MEDQLLLRVPPRVADPIRRFINGEADSDVSLEPLDDEGNFLFTVGDETFPAKLVRLPTISETHKTGDHKTYYKSGDVSRMLYVYERAGLPGSGGDDAPEPDTSTDDVVQVLPMVPDPTPGSGGELVCDSGITPPAQHIVRRRFRRAHRFISKYPREEVAEAERVLLDLMSREAYEHVVEELVDAEPFMGHWFVHGGDNVTIVYEDGVVTDMYQMQFPLGVRTREIRGSGKMPDPVVVKPNGDGTFGKPLPKGELGVLEEARGLTIKSGGPQRPGGGGGGGAGAGSRKAPLVRRVAPGAAVTAFAAQGAGAAQQPQGQGQPSSASAPAALPSLPPPRLIPGLMGLDDASSNGLEGLGPGRGGGQADGAADGWDFINGSADASLGYGGLGLGLTDADMASLGLGGGLGLEGMMLEHDDLQQQQPFVGSGEEDMGSAQAMGALGAMEVAAPQPSGYQSHAISIDQGGVDDMRGATTASQATVMMLDGSSISMPPATVAPTEAAATLVGAYVSGPPPLPLVDDAQPMAGAVAPSPSADVPPAGATIATGPPQSSLDSVAGHPDAPRLLAELDAAARRLADLQAQAAKAKEQMDRAQLNAMKQRWEKTLKTTQASIEAAEAQVSVIKAALDALR